MTVLTNIPVWSLEHLREHLQGAVDLEIWTIPYYMSAMYSVKDPSSDAYQLIQDVIHEEMLHVQLASNIANSFGLSPAFNPPVYSGMVPHVDFALDTPNPTDVYSPYSAEIGPLDLTRVNTSCLIEYPFWKTGRRPDLHDDTSEYGSIAEFYDAVRLGIYELRRELRGGVNQVDEFRYYYNDFPNQIVDLDGDKGYLQALGLIELITDQGEGQSEGDTDVAIPHRNTADGFDESVSHFRKFSRIRELPTLPATYGGVANPPEGSPGHTAQQVLLSDFAEFLRTLESLFSGEKPKQFGVQMAKIGSDILTCWKRGAIPQFSTSPPANH